MMPSSDRLIEELSVFSDIGTGVPQLRDDGNRIVVKMVRGGVDLALFFDKKTGKVVESCDGNEILRSSYRSMLASETFANLRSWAGAQQQVLRNVFSEEKLLPFSGNFSAGSGDAGQDGDMAIVDGFLTGERNGDGVRVLLIDGPAGIGKTRFIEILSYKRARDFARTDNPLILHVKSRGRVLTFLQDLMAFSLQNMRLQVTYDQIPILVRHGLIQLAIDGFDELGDPNGYDNAWAQVRELVADISGSGNILLAGRETFIGRERLLKAVPFLSSEQHAIAVFTLRAPDPRTARNWLVRQGWTDEQFRAAEEWDLFALGSYALRPFFLAQLADMGREQPDYFQSRPPLILLIERMIAREAGKFPDHAISALKPRSASGFVFDVLAEVARDIAENQSDGLDEGNLMWIVEAVLGDDFDEEISRVFKHRITAVAFLQPDNERKGRRTFSHTEFFNYFLAYAAVTAISRKEVPKFLRRMILGTDFLVTFSLVIEALEKKRVEVFLNSALEMLPDASSLDRGGRNIGALLMASLSVPAFSGRAIVDVDMDDAVARDTSVRSKLSRVTINQLDMRGADLSNVSFNDVIVVTAIADDTTRVPTSFPDVSYLQIQSVSGGEVLIGESARAWMDAHGRRPGSDVVNQVIPEDVADHRLIVLLKRVCRVMLRQHWIKADGDDYSTVLTEHELWDELSTLLSRYNLLEERKNLGTAGRPASVFHVRRAYDILMERIDNEDVAAFMGDVVMRAREISY